MMEQKQSEARGEMYRERIGAWVEQHREAFLEELTELLEIESVKSSESVIQTETGETQSAPFGTGPCRALKAAERLAASRGFQTKNYDNYCLAADLSDLPPRLDILAHLDVVPGGEGWTVTDPFTPKVVLQEGRIYGRGTSDDKGPALAALYAMQAVKELGIPLTGRARLILGTDEESGSACIAHYYETEPEAPMSISPDADYPVINTEKGRLPGAFGAAWRQSSVGARILRIEGGIIENAVPARAYAVLAGVSRMVVDVACATLSPKLGVTFRISPGGGERISEKEAGTDTLLTIEAIGKNAHAMAPEQGVNALTALLVLLSGLLSEDVGSGETGVATGGAAALQSLLRLLPHGETDGRSLGIRAEDPESGPLTVTFSMLSWTESGVKGLFDCRFPATLKAREVAEQCAARFEGEGFWFDGSRAVEAHRVPADSVLVKTLNEIYENCTGLPGGALSTGGGTYVHNLSNGVAFGAVFPGTDTRMHGADEYAVIDQLLKTIVMYALAIASLCA